MTCTQGLLAEEEEPPEEVLQPNDEASRFQ